jgi:Ni,Fe-hydrogenase I large subunit
VRRFLSYGAFDEQRSDWLPPGVLMDGTLRPLDTSLIRETTTSSYYRDSTPAHPSKGRLEPSPDKQEAYSWLKAPIYDGHCLEVGPLARLLIAEAAGNTEVAGTLRDFLAETGLNRTHLISTLGRHAARAIEAVLVAQRMEQWLDALQAGQTGIGPYERKSQGQGEGLIEAPRGALGHWIKISSNRIEHYQCVVPSTWNFSPRAQAGEPGPVEAALVGVNVNTEYRGLEVARTVRAFDPCIACAVH